MQNKIISYINETEGKEIVKKGSRKKQLKRALGMALALVMMFGSSLSVLAAGYNINNLSENQELQKDDEVYFVNEYGGGYVDIYMENSLVQMLYIADGTVSSKYIVPQKCVVTSVQRIDEDVSSPAPGKLYLSPVTGGTSGGATPAMNPDSGDGTGHLHDYKWKVVKDPTLREDGLAQSVCECGAVEAQQPISSATAFINMVRDGIEAAPQGGTVEISTEMYFCYTSKIMNALQARPDVSLKTNFFTGEGEWQSFTIPAGQAPKDGIQFYGFTGLANQYNKKEK